MSSSLHQSIREWIGQYVSGSISLREFQEQFVPRAWDIDSTGHLEAAQLASHIELLLAEYSNGDWTEEELKQKLSQYACPPQKVIVRIDEAPWIQKSTSSVLGTQPANSTKIIRELPLLRSPQFQVEPKAAHGGR